MKDTGVVLNRAKYLYKTCKAVKIHLEESKFTDLPTLMDAIYYGNSILYKILSAYNVSFDLTLRCEKFISEGFGCISKKDMSNKLDTLIAMYGEFLIMLKSFILKNN